MKGLTEKLRAFVALLMIAAMLLGMVGCAIEPITIEEDAISIDTQKVIENSTRKDQEKIISVLGKGTYSESDISGMDNETVQNLALELLSELEQIKKNAEDSGYYDENGAMTLPFDQAYPEMIEENVVEYDDESLLVKLYNSQNGQITEGMLVAGVAALEQVVPMENATWYEAKLIAGTDVQKALEALRQLPEVLVAEYNFQVQTTQIDPYEAVDDSYGLQNNEYYNEQWYMNHCGIADGYGAMTNPGGSSSVVVAVIDTGVDYDHEDLANNIWVNSGEIADNGIDDDGNGYVDDYYGVNIVAGYGNGDDDNGHGTHVAGIIAAENNGIGTVGIAYNVKIMPVKAAMASGALNQSDIAKAVLYAFEMGAEVINMSFGGTACSMAVQDALAVAYTRCVLVASAGNSKTHNEWYDFAMPNFPAALTFVLGVMSVDENGVESAFTNWDVIPYSKMEYEVYAPGNGIMSTLPNNQYGKLSGTSMAAPVVAAMAAILRSEHADRDMYPTKYIYGQLCSTSDYNATCINPLLHGEHNLPQIVNLYGALTKTPIPQVNMQDYAIFDTADIGEGNNGDGVIDAGETIALGLTLRNRWGMSKDTIVTIDANSFAGIADPYITIVNPEVNYGSVGTYSTQDAGAVYDAELLVGWDHPFYVKIADNCPNDYIFVLNVNIVCKNGLDENDPNTYVTYPPQQIMLTVRNGVILPSIINQDMVLTADNLYIIPTSTIIEEGTIVRVEPGTHIQFWSNDPSDPYGDSYIAYLKVKGTLLVEGTAENPVYIYPSDLMGTYAVDIGATGEGYVSLVHADITNFSREMTHGTVNLVDHCTFRQSYPVIYYRYVEEGVVCDNIWDTYFRLDAQEITNSVFYKVRGWMQADRCDTCIFVQSGLSYDGNYSNNVFLGNYYENRTDEWGWTDKSSSITVSPIQLPNESYYSIYYREETGTTYLAIDSGGLSDEAMEEYISQIFGGSFAVIETEDERDWLKGKSSFRMQITKAPGNDGYVWHDGTPVADFLLPIVRENDSNDIIYFSWDGILRYGWCYNRLFEIPGKILPNSITFPEYVVDMDLETTFQLTPCSAPVQLPLDSFVYESSDESVLTVSDTGLVTPVSIGTADIYVYSSDRAVYNYVTITVREYVALESITFPADMFRIAAGETISASCQFTPTNTTRRNVVYTSSDETVATVDNAGNITGVATGTATITATCEGKTATVTVSVFVRAEFLSLSSAAMSLQLTQGSVDLPSVLSTEGAVMDLSWCSTDESVAQIVDGKLQLNALGTTNIQVTDRNSGLTATCLVVVGDSEMPAIKEIYARGSDHYVLTEDGSLYYWNSNDPYLVTEGVAAFSAQYGELFLAKKDGTLERWYCGDSNAWHSECFEWFKGQNIAGVAFGYNGPSYYFVYTVDGKAYAWGGSSEYCQLGLGTSDAVEQPRLINLENVVDIATYHNYVTYFLTESGEVYYAGSDKKASTPTLCATGIAELYHNCAEFSWINALTVDGHWAAIFTYSNNKDTYAVDLSEMDQVAISGTDYGVGIKDGQVYTFKLNDQSPKTVPGLSNAKMVYTVQSTHYVLLQDNILLAFSEHNTEASHFPGLSSYTLGTIVPILLDDYSWENLTLLGNNLIDSTLLTDDELILQFNKGVVDAYAELYIDDDQFVVNATADGTNSVVFTRSAGFDAGTEYTLVIPAGCVHSALGATNAEEIRITFTYQPGAQVETDTDTGTVITPVVTHKSALDTTIQRVLTASIVYERLNAYINETQYNPNFTGNVILNPVSTNTTVSHWLRPIAGGEDGEKVPLGGNYWGSTNETTIGLQMIDYMDFASYGHFMYAPYLTQAPENTFPFVTSVTVLNSAGETVTTVGNETITVRITFNRDMDTSVELFVRFGSSDPYGDYEIAGQYVNARTWEGTYTLNTVIENGIQYWNISNGCSATDNLQLQPDEARFCFKIDTSAAQALIMQGNATDTGIELTWQQDDFDTLMGYNVYRSTSEDGYYQRLNSSVIPADQMSFFDDTVEPGVTYYYNFTVVQTDLTESEPSGKIFIMSKDTMAPDIYHSPITDAYINNNLVISATITDNLNIAYAKLYFRAVGQSDWQVVTMSGYNNKYSAIISAQYVTEAGLEYYIEAFDGVGYTYRGTADAPYAITTREPMAADALGDVDGDGQITNLDALLLLYAINDKYNLTAAEFERADLNADGVLSAAEALMILRYASGEIDSLEMP